MPYIKKIELKGFKSFGPQTVKVNLDKGFTAITGPNGSGKTNIMDALLFSLGELSTKRLRAENSAKLIFHGSESAGQEKAKMAKVVVQFDNSDGLMPVDTTTVTISREVYRNGQSVYRLNGRRMSRTHITETLSMAAISSMSQNIIPQGTITRLTDVNPLERRKIIEDLIGIAQYDDEKVEAEEKLRAADISIRTAMGRIDEVQKRLDDLERERNQLLRYNFIQTETKKFQAIKISSDIAQINTKINENTGQTLKVKERVDKLKEQRDFRRTKRHEIEGDWRKLSGEGLEQGGSEILKVQIKIGELKSKLTELNTKISSGQSSLESFKRVRENNLSQHENLRNEIRENRLRIRQFRSEYEKLKAQLTEKETAHSTLAQETSQLWGGLDGNNLQIRALEAQIENHVKRIAYLRSVYTQDKSALRLCTGRIKNLSVRKERFQTSQVEIEKSLSELEQVQKDQKAQLKNLEHTIERKAAQKETVQKEITDAEKIASSAKDAVVEFATQRDLAATIANEEKALRGIEEMSEAGAIAGIHGRLRNLIKIDKGFKKAVDAAATGWLDALVVKDIDIAFTCMESLRRMKLGRIKIIPLQGAITIKNKEPPKREDIVGPLLSFMKYDEAFALAVNYVFGDTVVVSNDKAAFALSNEGYRAVTVNGDLYEPGAFESGYYRAPIDFSTIIPSEKALSSLDEAIKALQAHLTQRGTDIVSIEEELEYTKIAITKLTESIATLEREIIRVKRGVKRTQFNIRHLEKYGGKLEREAAAYKGRMDIYRNERNAIRKNHEKIHAEIAALRLKTDVAHIQELEVQREKVGEELNTLRQHLGSAQTEISTHQSQFDRVLRIGYKNTKIQLSKVDQQQGKLEKEVADALSERETIRKEADELEKSRVDLSKAVFSAREESKKFTSQIDSIDSELRLLDSEYEQAERLLNQLQLGIETSQMRLQQLQSQLKQFGYEQPLETNPRQVQEAETTIRMMQFEMERIGAINQLASSHYSEQISRYRELSVRLNELEREKQAIVLFMDEIESKKRKVFMGAFEKINTSLKVYFAKLTGGGEATLKLENPDEPFNGGIDMIVQFPNKPSIVVSGASGGERSVSAVSFIFSLKEFTPASFYVLDEVDAHLDAFHTTKLAETLLEEAGKIQFIVISLRPEMVNKAQKVYGVYERNGVSNVVTAKFPAGGTEIMASASTVPMRRPFYLRPPWNILFEISKLEKVTPWNVNIAYLLRSFLTEMERTHPEKVDFRASGVALDSSALIYLMKSKLLLTLQEPPMLPKAPTDFVPPPLFLPLRHELTSTTIQHLLEVLDDVLKGEKLLSLNHVVEQHPVLPAVTDLLPQFDKFIAELELQVDQLYAILIEKTGGQGIIDFTTLSKGATRIEALRMFIYLLFLAQDGLVSLWQNEETEELYIAVGKLNVGKAENPLVEQTSNPNPEVEAAQEADRKAHHLALLEAALYVAGRPLDLNELCQVVGSRSKKRTQSYIETLLKEYTARNTALEILALKNERYVLQVKAEFTHLIKKLVNRPLLSSGPLKTLSYIAYRQPISQKRVIDVRGQHAYGHVKMLKDMGLIMSERSGRTLALKTTDYFADYFGLTTDTSVMKKDLKKIFGEAIKEDAVERQQKETEQE